MRYFCAMLNWILALMVCVLPWGLLGQVEYSISAASEALQGADYRLAAQILDSLEMTGAVNPNFYLAKGNAHFEAGQPGRAILAYERGLRLRPKQPDLLNNLRFVREQAGISTPDIPAFFLLGAWRSAGAFLGNKTSFVLSLIFWWLAVAGAVWWYLRKDKMEEKRRFVLLPAALLFALLALLFYGLGESRTNYLDRSDEAILLSGATLLVSPTAEGSVEAQLPEGVKLYITDRVNRYVKVQLVDGQTGYLPVEQIGII